MKSIFSPILLSLVFLSSLGSVLSLPNILFIILDDLDIGVPTLEYMPFVQKYMIAEGMTMKNAFATTPLCAPSRASILRGQYAHNHPTKSHLVTYSDTFPTVENNTLPVWLKKAGYNTGLFGKYFNGYGDPPLYPETALVSQFSGHIPAGWDTWFATVKGAYFKPMFSVDGERKWVEGYHTDLLAEHAIDFIQENFKEDDSTPFFAYIGCKAPHEPFEPANRHKDLFENVTVPQKENFNPPDSVQKSKPYPFDGIPRMADWALRENNKVYRKRLQTLQAVDELVRDLVTTLADLDQLDNTYIFFTSDHGYQNGQHRLWNSKDVSYEDSLRIPLIVRGPGIPKNTESNVVALNIDFAPTMCDMAKTKSPNFVDGISFLGHLLEGSREDGPVIREVFMVENFENPPYLKQHELLNTRGIRVITPDGKYNLMYNVLDGIHAECYDLNSDPLQLNNSCKNIPPQLVHSASPIWHEFISCSGKRCRNLTLDSICLHTPFGPYLEYQSICNSRNYGNGGKRNNWTGFLE